MAIDASIYSLLDTKGLQSGLAGIGDAYAQGVEQKGRLSQLAMEKEKFDMAKTQAVEKKNQNDMQELNSALAFGIQQKNGYSNQDLMNSTYNEAMRRGLKDEDVAQLFQPWASVANQTDGVVTQPTAQEQQGVADIYAQRANPQEAIKQRLEAMNRGLKVGEISPELRLATEINNLPDNDLRKAELIRQQKLKGVGAPQYLVSDQGIFKSQKGEGLTDTGLTKTPASSMWNQNLDAGNIEVQAQLVAEGKAALPSGRAALTSAGSAIIQRAKEINDNVSGQEFNTKKQAEVAFSKGKQADIVRNINVAFDHMGTAEKLATAMENSDIPAINMLANQFSKMTGGAKVTNFESVKNIVADEVAKGVIGGQTALADRETLADKIRSAGSPAQLSGVFESWKSLLGGQFEGLNRQYKGSTGKDLSGNYISSDLKNYRSKNNPVQNNQHPQDNEAVNWAKQNPNDPRSAKILQMNGL